MTQNDLAHLLLNATRVDLSHQVTNLIPRFSSFEILSENILFNIDPDGFYAKEYTIPTQYGTHIDAPIHFATGKRTLDELTMDELILPLYVLHFEDKVEKNHDFTVSTSDIKEYERVHGSIPEGSFVAFSSGWSKRWDDHDAFYNKDDAGVSHTPGWSVEALEYLHKECKVTAVGHETLDTDSGVDYARTNALAAEYYWLAQDKYQVEVMNNLHALPTQGGVIIVAPVNVVDSPGFSVRVFALIPNK
ncbi:cyclase family protein [Aerococcaceae bacterium DSM 111021]|nr:cyclase family protein [Aerococcaceae bacterium DSM 111021]